MASSITFNYENMNSAASTIEGYASDYRSAATTFESAFESAIASWEGDSKDKMLNFIQEAVMEYMNDTIPKLIDALAELLSQNAQKMQEADSQVAESIPQSLS